MNERYIVRCFADTLGCYVGRFAAQKAITHRIDLSSTISEKQAARYKSEADATRIAHRMAGKFTGTTWGIEPVGMDV